MGLFSFLKNAGAKVFENKAEAKAEEAAKIKGLREKALRAYVDKLPLDVNVNAVSVDGETVSVSGTAESQADKEKLILALGNIDGVAGVEDNLTVVNIEPEAKFYTVQRGDSLSKIAKEVYGDPMKYTLIFEANKPLLDDPNKIYPGQTLRIPAL